MAHPVQVGQPSRTFLAWNGTELVCERGHILLHIPEIPTSWFGAQRWVCLDPLMAVPLCRTERLALSMSGPDLTRERRAIRK
jgi:hypothetical protein